MPIASAVPIATASNVPAQYTGTNVAQADVDGDPNAQFAPIASAVPVGFGTELGNQFSAVGAVAPPTEVQKFYCPPQAVVPQRQLPRAAGISREDALAALEAEVGAPCSMHSVFPRLRA